MQGIWEENQAEGFINISLKKAGSMKVSKFFIAPISLIVLIAGCIAAPAAPPPVPPPQTPMVFKNTIVSLTFDDGAADNYVVRETLKLHHLHATFYIISGYVGKDGFMTIAQIKDLYADGNEIGAHTVTHPKLSTLSLADQKKEICQSRTDLMAMGFTITSFSYPYGDFLDETEPIVKDCGFTSGRAVAGGSLDDPFNLPALPYIVSDTRLPKMIRYVNNVEQEGGRWAIFVFHRVCKKCDYFSVTPETFDEFARWLEEQKDHGLVIKTVEEVMSEGIK